MDIHIVMQLIDEYVQKLEEWEYSSAYQVHKLRFDEWLNTYKCGGRQLAEVEAIIQANTGYAPEAIASLEDAAVVQAALYGVCHAKAFGERRNPDEVNDSARWAVENVRFAFNTDSDDDPNDWEGW